MQSNIESEQRQPFAWKLDPKLYKKSIFTGKKVAEQIEINLIHGFIKNKMGVFLDDHKSDFKHEVDQMVKYRSLYDAKSESFKTNHQLSKHKWGRLIPKNGLSLSVFKRSTRHSLAKDKYVDIDMQNSSPSIFCAVANQNKVEVPNLNKYCGDPKLFRQQIMEHHDCSKDVAKKLPIILTYGGSYDTWLKTHNIKVNLETKLDFIIGLESEMNVLRELIWAQNQHIYNDIMKSDPMKWKSDSHAKRGLMAEWCYTIERHCQESAITFLNTHYGYPITNAIPCQDGFMIVKSKNCDNDYYTGLCEEISNHMISHCNLEVTFAVKEMDEGFDIEPVTPEKSLSEWTDQLSERLLADKLIEKCKEQIIVTSQCSGTDESVSVFVFVDHKWRQENEKKYFNLTRLISTTLFDIVRDEITSDQFLTAVQKEDLCALLRRQTSKGSHINDIIRLMIATIPRSNTPFDSNPFLIGFENGVFDLKAYEFRMYKYDDFVTMSTGYNYREPDYENCPEDLQIREELFGIINSIQPDNENMNLLLQILASGLDGFGHQKLCLFNGQGGNGKGFLSGMMAKVLGDYFYQPSNSILADIETSSTSPSPEICSLKNKRYVNFQEVKGKLHGAFLKQLSGGGKFRGRMLHSNPIEFGMTWTMVMEFNEAPKITDSPGEAEQRRIIDLSFPTIFTCDESKVDKEVNGTFFKRANPKYVTDSFQESAKIVFLDMLLTTYKLFQNPETGMITFTIPEIVQTRTKEFLKDQDLLLQLFEVNFVFDAANITPWKVKELWEAVSNLKEYKELTQKEKREFNYKRFVEWLSKGTKVVQNKHTKVYEAFGIRRLMNDVDEEL